VAIDFVRISFFIGPLIRRARRKSAQAPGGSLRQAQRRFPDRSFAVNIRDVTIATRLLDPR
jgi:hypothetical protein